MSKVLGIFIMTCVTVAILAVVMALPIMLLWNWLMPEIFELGKITFMQSLGLFLLCSLLFKQGSNSTDK